jgi:hypothetical protein
MCPYADRVCVVAEAIAKAESGPMNVGALEEHLPCERCPRFLESRPAALVGIHLGHRARDLWSRAPAANDRQGALAASPTSTPAEREAIRRALHGLWGLGLVLCTRGTNGPWKMWLSPFGEALRTQYARELRSEARIRWDARVRAAAAEVALSPTALLHRTAEILRRCAKWGLELTAMVATAGGTLGPLADVVADAHACGALATAAERAIGMADQPGLTCSLGRQ